MKRVLWTLLLGSIAGACGSEPKPTVLDVSPRRAVRIPTYSPPDPIVEVSEPSTVFVFQSQRLRATIHWPHRRNGTISVPLGSLDDGSGRAFFVGITPDSSSSDLDRAAPVHCPNCVVPGTDPRDPCCPR